MNEQKRFADEEQFPYALLSDANRSIGQAYDAVRQPGERNAERGLPRRVTYLIAPDGTIAKRYNVEVDGLDLDAHATAVLDDIRGPS